MEIAQYELFRQGMDNLWVCYFGGAPKDPSAWSKRCREYFDRLKDRYRWDEVSRALMAAPNLENCPNEFPLPGHLEAIIRRFRSEAATQALEQRKGQRERESDERYRKAMQRVPNTPDGQEAWIAGGATPMEKLARLWAVESKQSGIRPEQQTPDDVFRRRMKEFWKIWDRHVEKRGSGMLTKKEMEEPCPV